MGTALTHTLFELNIVATAQLLVGLIAGNGGISGTARPRATSVICDHGHQCSPLHALTRQRLKRQSRGGGGGGGAGHARAVPK